MKYAHITLSYSYTLTINTICCVLLFLQSLVFVDESSASRIYILQTHFFISGGICATPKQPEDLKHNSIMLKMGNDTRSTIGEITGVERSQKLNGSHVGSIWFVLVVLKRFVDLLFPTF